MELTKKDYLTILNYYDYDIPKKSKLNYIKSSAENLIADKLCRCIKSVDKKNKKSKDERMAIAICKNSVLGKKNLTIKNFECKPKSKLISKKNTNKKLFKTKKKRKTKKA